MLRAMPGVFSALHCLLAPCWGYAGERRTSYITRLHSNGWSLCIGRDGRGLRGYCARSNDLGPDDLRDDAGLRGYRPADDREFGEPFHFLTTSAPAHLRGPGSTGRHTPAIGGDPSTSG